MPGQGPWNTELCMSNELMRNYMIHRALEKLRWDRDSLGGVQYIGVSDNDQGGAIGACECNRCTAARKADGGSGTIGQGGQSGLSLATANALAKGIILRLVRAAVRKAQLKFGEALVEVRFFHRLSHLAPAIVVKLTAGWLFADSEVLLELAEVTVNVYLVVIGSARALRVRPAA